MKGSVRTICVDMIATLTCPHDVLACPNVPDNVANAFYSLPAASQFFMICPIVEDTGQNV
jgi:hypothetical protein